MTDQRVALITGASRGIGAATARLLASKGMRIVVNYHTNANSAEDVVRSIREMKGEAIAVGADVRSREQVERMVAEAQRTFGSIDVLVSNAAMSFVQKPISEMQWEEFSHKLNDDMSAAFYVTTERTIHQPQALRDRLIANTPLGHLASAEDIAQAIAAYVSDGTGFITGAYVSVDGGMAMD